MLFNRKVKVSSNWSIKFAWLPVRGIQHAQDEDITVWIWLERYKRYFNYGAPVNYVIS